MTLIPDLLVTGILAIAAALAVGVWSVVSAGRRYGGLVLIILSVLLLVVGGGFGPPLIGVILGLAATRPAAPARRTTGRVQHLLGRLWPWFTVAGVAGFLGLMPGTVLLYELFDVESEGLVYTFAAVAFGGLVIALAAAGSRDREAPTRPLAHAQRR